VAITLKFMLRCLVILLLTAFLPVDGRSQQPSSHSALLSRMEQALSQHGGSMSVRMVYRVYADHEHDKIIDQSEVSLHKQGESQHVDWFGRIEVLESKNLSVTANHDSKILIVSNRGSSGASDHETSPYKGVKHFDELVKLYGGRIQLLELSKETGALRVDFTRSEYSRYVIEYDSRSFMPKRLLLYYRNPMEATKSHTKQPPRVEIEYVKYDLNPRYASDMFSVDRFVHKRGKRFEPASRFQGYQLINQVNQQ